MRRLAVLAYFLAATLTACGRDGDPSVASVPGDAPVPRNASVPRCGDPITAGGPLTLRGAFPARVARAGDGTFTGRVTVTAGGGAVRGVTSPEADVYVAQAGKVVATPLAKDLVGRPITLGPGASEEFGATGTIRPCADRGSGLLPPGRYEVFAAMTIVDDGGSPVVATGGPWPVEVG